MSSEENPTLSSQPELQALYPSLNNKQHNLPVLHSKQSIITFSAKNPDGHANRLDSGFAIFSGSIGSAGDVVAVMGQDACTWLGSETKTIEQRRAEEWKTVAELYPSLSKVVDVLADEREVEGFEKRFEGAKVGRLDRGWAVYGNEGEVLAVFNGKLCDIHDGNKGSGV